jgi:hypothetical protein
MDSLICKSAFHIQPRNKKNIFVGYLLNDYLSLSIILECNLTKQYLILDYSQWEKFSNENTFEFIFNSFSTGIKSEPHLLHLDDNFHYKIKTDSIILLKDDKRIKLNRDNLLCIRRWNDLISAKITEKNNKLHMYQSCFANACTSLKNDILYLPEECQRADFIDTYIQDYHFDFENIKIDEQKTFLFELQKFHHEQLADTLVQYLQHDCQ